jgi:phage terminase large subunit-like protein
MKKKKLSRKTLPPPGHFSFGNEGFTPLSKTSIITAVTFPPGSSSVALLGLALSHIYLL